jgi:hypothetical protein
MLRRGGRGAAASAAASDAFAAGASSSSGPARSFDPESNICLLTIMTQERLASLHRMLAAWDGYVSIALLVDSYDEAAPEGISLLRYRGFLVRRPPPPIANPVSACSTPVIDRWTERGSERGPLPLLPSSPDHRHQMPHLTCACMRVYYYACVCSVRAQPPAPERISLSIVEDRGYRAPFNRFPYNVLRNLALRGCRADFVMAADVDFVPYPANPSAMLRRSLTELDVRPGSTNVLVLAAFEEVDGPAPHTAAAAAFESAEACSNAALL